MADPDTNCAGPLFISPEALQLLGLEKLKKSKKYFKKYFEKALTKRDKMPIIMTVPRQTGTEP